MGQAVETALREELRAAGLPPRGPPSHLLALLRAAPETHLTLSDIEAMAAEAGLTLRPAELIRQLDAFVDHGLLGLLATTAAERVFDTLPQPHSHLIYEDSDQIVDLHVSAETLLAMVRDALSRGPDSVEVVVRFRRTGPDSRPIEPAGKPLSA